MDLKGAELKNFYHITDNIPSLSTQYATLTMLLTQR